VKHGKGQKRSKGMQQRVACVITTPPSHHPQYLHIAADNRALKMSRALSGLSAVLVSIPSTASGEGRMRVMINRCKIVIRCRAGNREDDSCARKITHVVHANKIDCKIAEQS
jgi:hypothetical protein